MKQIVKIQKLLKKPDEHAIEIKIQGQDKPAFTVLNDVAPLTVECPNEASARQIYDFLNDPNI